MEIHGILGSNLNNYHYFQWDFHHAKGDSCKINLCIILEREKNSDFTSRVFNHPPNIKKILFLKLQVSVEDIMQSREAKKQELIFSDHYVKCFSLKEFYKLFFFSLLKYYFYLFLSVPLNWPLESRKKSWLYYWFVVLLFFIHKPSIQLSCLNKFGINSTNPSHIIKAPKFRLSLVHLPSSAGWHRQALSEGDLKPL